MCPEPHNHFLLLCLRVYKDHCSLRSADISLALPLRGRGIHPFHAPYIATAKEVVVHGAWGILNPRDVGVTTIRSVTLLCLLRAHCFPGSVWLPPSQFPDHSGNGRNVRVTSMNSWSPDMLAIPPRAGVSFLRVKRPPRFPAKLFPESTSAD